MDLDFDYKFSDEDRQLSKQMMSYWANFARTGQVIHIRRFGVIVISETNDV
jgi:carboxylesterase type B